MAFVAVDKDGEEAIYKECPQRNSSDWNPTQIPDGDDTYWVSLPSGSIEKLIGRPLAWEDESVELTDNAKHPSDCKWCIDGICMKRTMCILGQFDCPDFKLKEDQI